MKLRLTNPKVFILETDDGLVELITSPEVRGRDTGGEDEERDRHKTEGQYKQTFKR